MAGSKLSDAPESNGSAVSFMHVKRRKEQKGDYMEVGGKGKTGTGFPDS